MAPDDLIEQAIQALLDGHPLPDSPGVADASGEPLRVIDAIARAQRKAIVGSEFAPEPQASARWVHLEIRGEIGRGASGTVYRAWDTRLAREVALKLFAPDGGPGDAALEEGRLLARVNHPHVVRVLGSDSHAGTAGIWMELLEGDTLDEVLRRDGVFGAEEALLIGLDLARALGAVHSAGLLHRDIKAGNVLVERGGRIVLMDLGAGRTMDGAPHTGDATGTPVYMAPEVLGGSPATVQSDIYCVGVVLFRLVAGTLPVTANDLAELRTAHAARRRTALRTVRQDLTAETIATIERACHPEASARYASAAALETALTHALQSTLSDRAQVAPAIKRTLARWKPILRIAAVAIATALLGIGGAWDTVGGRAARRALGLTVPPRSPLYLTLNGGLAILRGRQLSVVPNPASALPIAVSTNRGVVTVAGLPPWTTGASFRLDGTEVASQPTVNEGLCCFNDGTTDGRYNYAPRHDSTLLEPEGSRPLAPPALYRFDRDWSNPTQHYLLPADGVYFGVAYSEGTDSLWLTRKKGAAAVIEQWSRDGRLLSTPVSIPTANLHGIAVDPKDGTLWVVRLQNAVGVLRLENFDSSGRRLGSFETDWPHALLPASGAEFAWIRR